MFIDTKEYEEKRSKRSKILGRRAQTQGHEGVLPLKTGFEKVFRLYYGHILSFYGYSELIVSTIAGILAGTARNWMKASLPLIELHESLESSVQSFDNDHK